MAYYSLWVIHIVALLSIFKWLLLNVSWPLSLVDHAPSRETVGRILRIQSPLDLSLFLSLLRGPGGMFLCWQHTNIYILYIIYYMNGEAACLHGIAMLPGIGRGKEWQQRLGLWGTAVLVPVALPCSLCGARVACGNHSALYMY